LRQEVGSMMDQKSSSIIDHAKYVGALSIRDCTSAAFATISPRVSDVNSRFIHHTN
jgi:hypothetical protein